jgi:hypothetical protein
MWAVPIITAATAVAGTGYSIYAGEKAAKAQKEAQKRHFDEQQRQAKETEERTSRLFGSAESAFNPVVDYWGKMLTGNRGQLTSLLSPEINRINSAYSGAKQSMMNLAPRGGGRSALMSELPFRQAADVGNAFLGARPAAAQNLMGAGVSMGQLANAGQGNLMNLMNGMGQTQQSIFQNGLLNRQNTHQLGEQFGGQLADLMKYFTTRNQGGGGGMGLPSGSSFGGMFPYSAQPGVKS